MHVLSRNSPEPVCPYANIVLLKPAIAFATKGAICLSYRLNVGSGDR